MKRMKQMPSEIKWRIFSFLSHQTASIFVDAFRKNKLKLKHIYVPKVPYKIWRELRPLTLESNVYGSKMYIIRYIIRTKLMMTEEALLLS